MYLLRKVRTQADGPEFDALKYIMCIEQFLAHSLTHVLTIVNSGSDTVSKCYFYDEIRKKQERLHKYEKNI